MHDRLVAKRRSSASEGSRKIRDFLKAVVTEILKDSQRPGFSEAVVISNVEQCLAAEILEDSQLPELDVERGDTANSNDSPPYLRTPCRRPTGDVALNSPGERSVRHSTIRFCVVPQLHDGMEARKNSILTECILFAILTQHP